MVGNRVIVERGVQLWDGVTLEDDVFVGPNATFTNQGFPPAGTNVERTLVKIRRVHRRKRDAASGRRHWGTRGGRGGRGGHAPRSSACHRRGESCPYRRLCRAKLAVPARRRRFPSGPRSHPSRVAGVTIHRLPLVRDLRGFLTVVEPLPFEVKRFFMVFDVPSRDVRGEHAHRTLHQFLVASMGSAT